jgi:hypothetical protein
MLRLTSRKTTGGVSLALADKNILSLKLAKWNFTLAQHISAVSVGEIA